jgi:hypothetical protein
VRLLILQQWLSPPSSLAIELHDGPEWTCLEYANIGTFDELPINREDELDLFSKEDKDTSLVLLAPRLRRPALVPDTKGTSDPPHHLSPATCQTLAAFRVRVRVVNALAEKDIKF